MHTHSDSRAKGVIGTAIVQLLVGWALFAGLGSGPMRDRIERQLATFDVLPDATPEPEPSRRTPTRRAAAREAHAPPALRATPTEVVAPLPIVPPLAPPPIYAAPVAGTGAAPTAGAADTPGPGTGAGGDGDGSGGGGYGGDGYKPPKWLRGKLKTSDYPVEAGEAGIGHPLTVRYRVLIDGSVGDCRVIRSTGAAILDATACRLIRERYRFKPSRDDRGNPVSSQVEEDYTWFVGAKPKD